MKSILLSDSDKEAIVQFVKQHEELMTRPTTVSKTSRRKKDFGSSYQKLAYQDYEEVVQGSTYQI